MKKIIKKLGITPLLALLMTFTLLAVTPAVAGASNIADGICRGILSAEGQEAGDATTASGCTEDGNQSFSFLVRRVINVLSILVGAVSVIMIIIGGFRYIISGGDSAGVSAAKNTILYAIVGLVIVLFAQVIIRFVYSSANPSLQNRTSTTQQ